IDTTSIVTSGRARLGGVGDQVVGQGLRRAQIDLRRDAFGSIQIRTDPRPPAYLEDEGKAAEADTSVPALTGVEVNSDAVSEVRASPVFLVLRVIRCRIPVVEHAACSFGCRPCRLFVPTLVLWHAHLDHLRPTAVRSGADSICRSAEPSGHVR